MKVEFSCHIFEKFSNIKLCDNPLVGGEMFHAERTDEQTDMPKQVDVLCNLRKPLKTLSTHTFVK